MRLMAVNLPAVCMIVVRKNISSWDLSVSWRGSTGVASWIRQKTSNISAGNPQQKLLSCFHRPTFDFRPWSRLKKQPFFSVFFFLNLFLPINIQLINIHRYLQPNTPEHPRSAGSEGLEGASWHGNLAPMRSVTRELEQRSDVIRDESSTIVFLFSKYVSYFARILFNQVNNEGTLLLERR